MNSNFGNDYGKARAATEQEMRAAKIIGKKGVFFGYYNRHALRLPSDGHIGIWGGVGCGKSSAFFTILEHEDYGENSIAFDPKGEISAVTMLISSLLDQSVYYINPFSIANLPMHLTNPFDHLTLYNPSLIVDLRKTISDLLPPTGGKQWWIDDAYEIVCMVALHLATTSHLSLRSLYKALCDIGEHEPWIKLSEEMQHSQHAEVRGMADALIMAKDEGKQSYLAPMQAIKHCFNFMQEPAIAAAFPDTPEADFSLGVVSDRKKKARVKVIIPAQHIGLCSGLIRLLLGRPIQDKFKMGGNHRISVLIDECGQISKNGFPSILDAYTYGRGMGVRAICSWQEYSQTVSGFGREDAETILGSAQLRIFAGVRTLETAQLVSQMAGVSTYNHINIKNHAEAKHRKRMSIQAIMRGEDFSHHAAEIHHYNKAVDLLDQQSRSLITADEVLNYDGMIAFASGLLEGAIFGQWPKYFDALPNLGGKYLCNPYHDPEFVTIKNRFFTKKARMITAKCPRAISSLPQHANGQYQYIDGYKPRMPLW